MAAISATTPFTANAIDEKPFIQFPPSERFPPSDVKVDTCRDGELDVFLEGKSEPMQMQPPLHKYFRPDSYGITQDGRHVLQQQALRSCVPTALTMLLLDQGVVFPNDQKAFDDLPSYIQAIQTANLGTDEDIESWLKGTGFYAKLIRLEEDVDVSFLSQLLSTYGSSLLTIDHSELGLHQVVLDKIDHHAAIIRDPYSGLSYPEIPIETLLSWHPNEFIALIPLLSIS